MDTSKLYEGGEYEKLHPSWHFEDAKWKSEAIYEMLKRHPLEITKVGDVGCGAGGILYHLQKALPVDVRFYGFDISPQAIRLSKKWENERLVFQNTDLLELGGYDFDLILCIDVLEHIEDYLGFLKKLRLKGRYKIFHIPLDLSANSLVRPSSIRLRRTISGHLHYFTKETVLLSLEDTEYKIIDFAYTNSTRNWILAKGRSLSASARTRSLLFSTARNLIFSLSPDFAVRLLGGYSLLVLAS